MSQGTVDLERDSSTENTSRDWEESEWFQEWLECHEHETVIATTTEVD